MNAWYSVENVWVVILTTFISYIVGCVVAYVFGRILIVISENKLFDGRFHVEITEIELRDYSLLSWTYVIGSFMILLHLIISQFAFKVGDYISNIIVKCIKINKE